MVVFLNKYKLNLKQCSLFFFVFPFCLFLCICLVLTALMMVWLIYSGILPSLNLLCFFLQGRNWFQINSLGYNKCLTARVRSYGFYTRVNLHIRDCTSLSNEQGWRWISGGRLQSALNNKCLAVTSAYRAYQPRIYMASLQPCDSFVSNKQWVCKDGFLKLRNREQYLTPYLYNGRRQSYGGVRIRSSPTNSCKWSRHGSSKSVCGTKGILCTITTMIFTTHKGACSYT